MSAQLRPPHLQPSSIHSHSQQNIQGQDPQSQSQSNRLREEESLVIFSPTVSSALANNKDLPSNALGVSLNHSRNGPSISSESPSSSSVTANPDWLVVLSGSSLQSSSPSLSQSQSAVPQFQLETSVLRHDGTGSFRDTEGDVASVYASAVSFSPTLSTSSVDVSDSSPSLSTSANLESISSSMIDGTDSWDSGSTNSQMYVGRQGRRRSSRFSRSSPRFVRPDGDNELTLGGSWTLEASGLESLPPSSETSSSNPSPKSVIENIKIKRPQSYRISSSSSSQVRGPSYSFPHPPSLPRRLSIGSPVSTTRLSFLERLVNRIFSLERETMKLIEEEMQRPYSSYILKGSNIPSSSVISVTSEGEKHGLMRVARESRVELGTHDSWKQEDYGYHSTDIENIIGPANKRRRDGSRTPRVRVTPVIERLETAKVEERLRREAEISPMMKDMMPEAGEAVQAKMEFGDMMSRVVGRWSAGWDDADFGASRSWYAF